MYALQKYKVSLVSYPWPADIQGQLCVLKKFSQNCIFNPIYMNKVRLNGNSKLNIIANLHEKLANHV
jgi:hypothetical protein